MICKEACSLGAGEKGVVAEAMWSGDRAGPVRRDVENFPGDVEWGRSGGS